MSVPFWSLMTGVLLLLTVVMPSLGIALGASSMSPGILFVAGMYIFFFSALSSIYLPDKSLRKVLYIVFVVVAIVFFHGILSYFLNSDFNLSRFWQSCCLLVACTFGAYSLVQLGQVLPKRQVEFSIKFVFWILLFSGVAGVYNYSPFFKSPIPVLFFSEKSHYALDFFPFLLYMVTMSSFRVKKVLIITVLVMVLFIQNLTLFVGVAFIALFAFPARQFVFFLVFCVLVFVIVDPVDVLYYSSRVNLTIENTNLSALVFMQGWERAFLNFFDYNGVGIGFQQLGFVGSQGEIMGILSDLGVPELNLLDGGTVGSKFVSEFGLLAIIVLFFYLVYFVRGIKLLYRVSMKVGMKHDPMMVFFLACFVMFFINLFVRGTGYFSSSGFLFLSSLLWFAVYDSNGFRYRYSVLWLLSAKRFR